VAQIFEKIRRLVGNSQHKAVLALIHAIANLFGQVLGVLCKASLGDVNKDSAKRSPIFTYQFWLFV
jgi:hypothetical protein